MKTASKFLSMLLLVAMCLSLMGGSAYAFDLNGGGTTSTDTSTQINSGNNAGSGLEGNLGSGSSDLGNDDPFYVPSTPESTQTPDSSGSLTGEEKKPIFDLFSAFNPSEGTAVDGDGTSYSDIQAAIDAGKTNIKLNQSQTVESLVLSGKVIDLNNYTLKVNNLTMTNSTVKNGTLVVTNPVVVNGASNYFTSLNVQTNGKGFSFPSSSDKLTINGGTYTITSTFFDGCSKGNLSIVTGSFGSVTVPEDLWADNSFNDGNGNVSDGLNVAQVGSNKYTALQSAIDNAQDGQTVTLIPQTGTLQENVTISKSLTLDLAGEKLDATVTVNGGTVKITNGGVKEVVLNSGAIFYSSDSLTVYGNFRANTGSTAYISGGYYNNMNNAGTKGTFTGGYFRAVNGNDHDDVTGVYSDWLATGYQSRWCTEVTGYNWQVVPVSATAKFQVTQLYGNVANSFYTYDLRSSNNTSMSYSANMKVSDILLIDSNGQTTTLTERTHYTVAESNGTYQYTILGSAVSNRADRFTVRFKSIDGFSIADFYIYVLPKVDFSNINYYKNSSTAYPHYVFTNQAPAGYQYAPSGTTSRYTLSSSSYTVSGNEITLNKSFLDGLNNGSYDLYYCYPGGSYVKIAGFAINGNYNGGGGDGDGGGNINPGKAAVYPAYENTWYSGDGTYYFTVIPDLKPVVGSTYTYYEVAIDGIRVGGDKLTYNGVQTFGVAASYMNNLATGSHTISVLTSYGYASGTFRVGATLKPVDTDKHVIGSSKNLQFVCSDPISQVWVGGTQLINNFEDYYALSSSGKTLTLSAAFLNARTAGSTYTLTVQTIYGDTPSCTFQILTKAQASASPQTGDESNLALWAAALILSGGAMVAVMPRLKKGKNK